MKRSGHVLIWRRYIYTVSCGLLLKAWAIFSIVQQKHSEVVAEDFKGLAYFVQSHTPKVIAVRYCTALSSNVEKNLTRYSQ